ncbi:hypothetical protein F4556_001151 [Kitasatospora gansuensis]|uniref:Uncharacterized protein n=1 Tax=Kitasatospora gansuensis TaxID=258050 RepID=A0A7W7WFX1_9ACTN|nr:hypothetical protein [Kitasatospora gansuensis]MBB4945616.1 hypothetical protein [Kitasatospora gansuensis]
MAALRNLLTALLLPVKLCLFVFHYRVGRVRAARAAGDRGAISIELALAIIVLVGVAVAVLAVLATLAKNVTSRVPSDAVVSPK